RVYSQPRFAQQGEAAFSFEVLFLRARPLSPTLPREAPFRLQAPLFRLAEQTRYSGWVRPFSPRLQFVLATPPAHGSAQAHVRCFALAQLRYLKRLIRPFSFSTSEFDSSPRSEIDPEDLPKPPPELAPVAYRSTQRQCTQR